jgi:PQQ-dependent dehydrogenase (methanol/ethanol family)
MYSKYLLALGTALASGPLFSQPVTVADNVTNPLAANPSALFEGRQLFEVTCQICHGAGGQGDRDRGGSALNVTTLKQGNRDADLFRVIRNGVQGTPMPPFAGLTDPQTWQIISYIRSLQNIAPEPATAAVPGDIGVGEQLFFGRATCSECHEVNARGGITGPDLSNVGRLTPDTIRQKITSPNSPAPAARGARGAGGGGRGGAAPVTVVARTPDGREIRGVRRNEDNYSLQMVDAQGKLHLIDKLKMASVTEEPRSLMPDDFGTRLSAGEITNLVAYLSAQKVRDFKQTIRAPLAGGVSYERLKNAGREPHNWLTYWGDYQGTHYSALDQINPGNAASLRPAWTFPILGGTTLQGTPLVVDGIMYATGSGDPTSVTALDARTGRAIWRWSRPQRVVNPFQINPYIRGVAILGNRLFVGTLDAVLIALDARTGQQLWEVPVADTMEGYNITSPPLALKDMVITGIAGGEYATRGFIDAYDAATGQRRWRYYTIPAPGEPGNETWLGDSWKYGGAPTWLTGSYDPELNLLYWTAGNPAEQINRSVRGELDNLYSDSVLALDPDSGRLKWHFQFTPNDGHDWDSNQDVILVDRPWRGQQRKLMLHADRNGHFYVLDRTNGEFLSGTPFIYQNWNAGFDAKGRPRQIAGSNSSAEGSFLVYPTAGGATNWQSPSYSPLTGLFYLAYSEGGQQYVSEPQTLQRGRQYLGRAAPRAPPLRRADQPAPNAGIKALDPDSGKTVWDFKIHQGSLSNGVLATGGNVLFASTRDGNLTALDARTGRHLWHFQTGGAHAASPMSYAVDGKQYVALSAGNVLFSFALPDPIPGAGGTGGP